MISMQYKIQLPDSFDMNIIRERESFGWQTISTAIPLVFEKKENFNSSRYCLEITREISESTQMERLSFSSTFDNSTSQLLFYNPEKWQCKEYYFFKELPEQMEGTNIYEILHLSLEQ